MTTWQEDMEELENELIRQTESRIRDMDSFEKIGVEIDTEIYNEEDWR